MMQKLIILGSLKNRPSSGYDIKKFMEKELEIFSILETRSIYYSLKKMEAEGLIKKKELNEAHHLKKYIYSITPKGEREFINFCNEALLSKKRPFMDIDLPLYFLPYLDKNDVVSRLRLQRRFLGKAKEWLIDKLNKKKDFGPHHKMLLKHHLNLLGAQDSFIEGIIGVVKDYPKPY